MTGKKILVIGSGGREHAICWKLSQSSKVDQIYCLPGSFGIGQLNKVEILFDISINDFKAISTWCEKNSIDIVIVGPEDPLAGGICDELHKSNIRCFGPGKLGAQIESNKKWAKDFMIRHEIPTARYEWFTDVKKAKDFLNNAPFKALVVKASGLAAGKGVVVASNINEACEAVDEILNQRKYGTAGDVVVIEELLVGEEISVLAFVDNNTVRAMLPAQDHKRLNNNDEGPNTGGMGAYCPCPLISNSDLEIVNKQILQKAIDGLREEGIHYCGVLYAGIILTANGPVVLEFNCRFGDPETQVILPLLNTDLYDVMSACCDNKLNDIELQWKNDLSAVGVVMASSGYPESSTKGCVIEGIPENTEKRIIFHSGLTLDSKTGKLLTNGGRVLISVYLDNKLKNAALNATKTCHGITFSGAGGAQYRNDIAAKAFKLSLSYKDSGVDIDAGDDLVQRIKPLARGTSRTGVLGALGGFGGLFNINELQYKNPVICEVTGGVGTKIKLSLDCELYESIGYDLVAECVNSVLESGSEPIAFLDYIACGKLQVPIAAQIIKGISEGCREANCALLGGETAEMPSVYSVGKYDMAGYCIGILEEGYDLPKFDMFEENDLIIGLPSSGLHCSGFDYIFQLIQKLGLNLKNLSEFGDKRKSFGNQLLLPSRIYVKDILWMIKNKNCIKFLSHINTSLKNGLEKLVQSNFSIEIDLNQINIPDVYGWLAVNGQLSDETLVENFNCGLGMLFVVPNSNTDWMKIPNAKCIGKLKSPSTQKINILNLSAAIESVAEKFYKNVKISRTNKIKLKNFDELTKNVKEILKLTQHNESFNTQSGKQLTKISKKYIQPILVAGTDGVGTKIKIAQQCNINTTVGIDLVAMCANDILCNGAEPLTFLSYYGCGVIDDVTTKIIANSIAEGSKQAGCSLIDFYSVEVPLLYKKNIFDLAGFSLGITEFNNMLPRIDEIKEGDLIFGLPSNGVHSNGFSLIHKIMEFAGVSFEDKAPFGEKIFGEELLAPTKIYVDAISPLLSSRTIKALAHITGGGLIENIPRVLNKNLGVHLDARNWNIPPIFGWLAENGNISSYEMQRTFNCGIGLIIIVNPINENFIMDNLKLSHHATKIGAVIKRKSLNTPQVIIDNFEDSLISVQRAIKLPKKRVAVLISGSGTNLQALIDTTRNSNYGIGADIVLVISNRSAAFGLQRAKNAGIPAVFISAKKFGINYDMEISRYLEEYQIDIICLAGYMKILTANFVKKWIGKLINIHPSLLPKHPGLNVQQRALDAGDKESGCTVHFVDEGVDTGPIIVQEKVPILPNDDVDTLSKRILVAEHYSFPKALKLVATESVKLRY